MGGSELPIRIPYEQLSSEALDGIVQQFISKDGQDSGHSDIPFEKKMLQVKQQLKAGRAVIFFDQFTQTCNIILKDDPLINGA